MVEHTRSLGFRVAFAIGLGTMIAAGIFSLSGIAVASVGSSAVVAFGIAAVVAGLTAASYSEFASIYSENGGGYLFSSRTFEDDRLDPVVYFVGASLFVGYTGTTAFYLATMDHWFFRFIVPPSLGLPHGTVAVVTAVLLGVLNARGTEESGLFQVVVTAAKVAVLLVFVGGVVAAVGPGPASARFVSAFEYAPMDILTVASLAFITFFGFSAIAASAGEIVDPRVTVPRAIATSILTVVVLYVLVIVAMVNSPVPAAVIAQEGETAMGRVAAAALGPVGFWLIVAGAAFSMVSASNASILAASGIGSLMGRQGHASRRLARIHREYRTPFWSVAAATATIVGMIVVFLGIFPAEGGAPFGIHLGLTPLTGFATLNLLVPLAVVNVALVYSRRRYPDLERPFRVPLVPLVPAAGILANLALVATLPPTGVLVGLLVIVGILVSYVLWGRGRAIEDLFAPVPATETGPERPIDPDRYRVLVPVADPEGAPDLVSIAVRLAAARADDPEVEVLHVTQIPDQTPFEVATEQAAADLATIEAALEEASMPGDYRVSGHVSRDVAFDINETARRDDADLILMGYPEDHREITEAVEYEAPCDVVFVAQTGPTGALDPITIGVGGGPHHIAVIPMVESLVGSLGAEVHLVNVRTPDAVPEDPGQTLAEFTGDVEATVHTTRASSIAEGLVSVASDHGGVLLVGASRTRRLNRWIFGSTPDRVVDLAAAEDLTVLVYASRIGLTRRVEDWLFPVYRVLRRQFGGRERHPGGDPTER
ncbi:MAG: amino acid permease [Halanaeroarchaeum sp.]